MAAPATATVARIEEPVAHGQAVARYTLYGSDGADWSVLTRGTTIGYAKLDRFPSTRVRKIRLVIEEAAAPPAPVVMRLYAGA